ncbi:hypothetical protein BKA93DRAFT_461364 [Sparassis latifolia]|uniref:Uncharacterized protein n=1 Tax=Sparassis crispa TaxID=139825 RepID=A0A401H3U8_9APHY|nr:hypothetical protein SCP_1501180 [Sparassis crispa]GBE89115.1 hypothetical protein SCP_1501180 [Sparassis crispa]
MQFKWIGWMILLLLFMQAVSGQVSSNNETELICRPFGTCEPCPEDALNEPFCQPFGNRRLMHCVPAYPSNSTSRPDPASPFPPHHGPPGEPRPPPHPNAETHPLQGEIPAWESCGRIVEKERADFYEFLACNFVIAVLALVVLFARSKRLQAMHARQLAARIGLVRDIPAGWVNG